MRRKKVLNKKKVITFIIIVALIVSLSFVAVFEVKKFFGTNQKAKVVKVVDKIDEYGYSLNENETKYYKSLFEDLKKMLSKENVNDEEYASLVSKLFLTDFFSLSNSTSKNDVGGVQFVYSKFQNDFINLAKESIYSTVESNIYGNRKQDLPTVEEVVVDEVRQESFEYEGTRDEAAYTIDLTIKYKEDMEYQKDVTLKLVHNDKKIEIVEMK